MPPANEKVLIVDDDADIRRILQDRLENLGYRVSTAVDGQEALDSLNEEEPDLMFLDLQMPRVDGMQVLKKMKEHPGVIVIIITAFGTFEKAVEAIKEGAFDFITKPFSPSHLEVVIRKALDCRALRQENQYLHQEIDAPYHEILGQSTAMKQAMDMTQKVAASNLTVLLLGESGTGKEIFARAIHRWSTRSRKPFVVVNCVALRDELLESELFGHERGSFTGAFQMKKGKLEIADGGTVFLDEIGDLKTELQAKLLRILQEREFERVGGTKQIHVDLRFVTATNRDLARAVQEGRFREDLFFRLNVVSISLPPLRTRREDIPSLAQFFLARSCHSMKKPIMKMTSAAQEHLMEYQWPGNVRELENLIERAVVLAKGAEIQPEDLPLHSLSPFPQADYLDKPYHDAIRICQKKVIQNALEISGGNQAKASDRLKLQRTYLARLIKKLQIR